MESVRRRIFRGREYSASSDSELNAFSLSIYTKNIIVSEVRLSKVNLYVYPFYVCLKMYAESTILLVENVDVVGSQPKCVLHFLLSSLQVLQLRWQTQASSTIQLDRPRIQGYKVLLFRWDKCKKPAWYAWQNWISGILCYNSFQLPFEINTLNLFTSYNNLLHIMLKLGFKLRVGVQMT